MDTKSIYLFVYCAESMAIVVKHRCPNSDFDFRKSDRVPIVRQASTQLSNRQVAIQIDNWTHSSDMESVFKPSPICLYVWLVHLWPAIAIGWKLQDGLQN